MRSRGASDPVRQWVLNEIFTFLKSPVPSELLSLNGCPVSIYMTSSLSWVSEGVVCNASIELPHAVLLLFGLDMPAALRIK